MSDGKSLLKIAKNEYALTHNKLEKFILNELTDERILRHIPIYFGRSANYWVLHLEYIDGEEVSWDTFWEDPDILGFQELALDQDLYGNVLWSSFRQAWIVVDLGMCWDESHLKEIITLLRKNESIEDYAD